MLEWITKLNKLSLKEFPDLFASSAADDTSKPSGTYRAAFVGPGWLRAAAGPALAISGLGGWWGKQFKDDGTAVNLVQHGGKLEPRFPMRLINTASALDGKLALALIYETDNPFPWPHIVDELRLLDGVTFLGMTYVNAGPLRKLTFPFLLEYQEQIDGL
jgi:hypothetical protein